MDQAMPIFAAMSRKPAPFGRWQRGRWLAFLLVNLGWLAYPVTDLLHRHLGIVGVAAGCLALAVFAVLDVRVMWLSLGTTSGFRAAAPSLAGLAALGGGLALGLGGDFVTLFIFVSICAAVTVPLRWILPSISAATLAAFLGHLSHLGYLRAMPGSLANNMVNQLSLIFFLGLMMAFYRRAMMLVLELRQARDELARLAVTEERLRFARDLHDLLGHSLSTIALKSQVARRLVDRDPVALTKEVDEIGAVAQQALLEVREAVTGYRRRSTATELDTARSTLAAAGIEVTVRTSGTPLPADTDGLLAWVVREGTTNVLRHSKGRMCWITLRRTEDSAGVEIRDDGVGPAGSSGDGSGVGNGVGNGLAGLAERLAAVGGRLDTGPAPGRGFRLSAHLPLADAPTSPATAHLAAP